MEVDRTPHGVFRRDFDAILQEGRRQEEIHAATRGEYAVTERIHGYFDAAVMPLIITDDWVFEAAGRFASQYAFDCFRYLRLAKEEFLRLQERLLQLNSDIVDFVARVYVSRALTNDAVSILDGQDMLLTKESDLLSLVDLDKLSKEMRSEALDLSAQAQDHEPLQLLASVRGIRDAYETTLPRLMYAVRRAMKVELGLPRSASDSKLLNPSESLGWYAVHLPTEHTLHPLLVDFADFYKTVRNVGNHHEGFSWHPATNEVWLADSRRPLMKAPLYDFQQRYRYLAVYLCDYGVRGVLAAYCEREQGPISDMLLREYDKIFV